MKRANLRHMNETEILVHSKALSGKTNADLARAMILGEETVARYLRPAREGEHTYGLPIGRVSLWARATGNHLIIDWICQQAGGVYVPTESICSGKESVAGRIGRVNSESATAITLLIEALRDGVLTEQERMDIEQVLLNQKQELEGALISLRARLPLGVER